VRLLVAVAPAGVARLADVRFDGRVLAFALAATALSTVGVGLLPALHVARDDWNGNGLRASVRTATSRGAAARRALIAIEVAAVVVLLTTALLLIRTFAKLRAVDLGFQPQHILTVQARWPLGRLLPPTPGVPPWPHLQRAADGVVAAVASVPGVEAAGLMTDLPLAGDGMSARVWSADAPGAHGLEPPADPGDSWTADLSIVSAGYFEAMNIAVIRGRNFGAADGYSDEQLQHLPPAADGVVIVNRAFASKYFGGADPVGRTLVIPDDRTFGARRRIVGIVGDVRAHSVADPPRAAAFIPHGEHSDLLVPSVVARTSSPPQVIAPRIRQRLQALDPNLLVQIRPMGDLVSGALSRQRFNALLLGTFALLAFVLSLIGVYAVLAYLLAQRTREIAIRVALGARRSAIVGLLVKEGMSPVVFGSAAGVATSLITGKLIRSLLFGVSPLDPISVSAAPLLLLAVALVACTLPARRALRVDPVMALRAE
jgi:putative ABC transport system permease protein